VRFLLNSNIVSDIVRRPRGKITHRISEFGEGGVCTSIIVAAELRYGATKKNSPRLTAQLEAVLGALEVLALEAPADIGYRTIRASLERKGRPIGANDLLIAAHAQPLDLTLVTVESSLALVVSASKTGCAKRTGCLPWSSRLLFISQIFPSFEAAHGRPRAVRADDLCRNVRLSDIEPRFVCEACGTRGADVRPNFYWEKDSRESP
jgi:tRNA(fMet)-specific endonuclease VapC